MSNHNNPNSMVVFDGSFNWCTHDDCLACTTEAICEYKQLLAATKQPVVLYTHFFGEHVMAYEDRL